MKSGTGVVMLGVAIILAAASLPSSAQPAKPTAEVRGKRLFLACQACHAVTANPGAKAGPTLHEVSGRAAGQVAGFAYSRALRGSGLRWDDTTLDRFIAKPSAVVPGTSMAYQGMRDPRDRNDLIAYLKQPPGRPN